MENPENYPKTNITLKMLIDSGLFIPGQRVFSQDGSVSGFLNTDGSITVHLKDQDKTFEYLSGAARYIEKRSLNGWLYWHVLVDGQKVALDTFRDQYLDQNSTTS